MTDQTIKQKLIDVLAAHAEWVKTDGQAGVQLNLSDADLTDAELTGAKLNDANLCNADLTGADLSGVMLDTSYYDRKRTERLKNPFFKSEYEIQQQIISAADQARAERLEKNPEDSLKSYEVIRTEDEKDELSLDQERAHRLAALVDQDWIDDKTDRLFIEAMLLKNKPDQQAARVIPISDLEPVIPAAPMSSAPVAAPSEPVIPAELSRQAKDFR